ncbi:MAG: hypothetical protein ACKPKO_04055, partial [Candidatus Fonsibacter sp.]
GCWHNSFDDLDNSDLDGVQDHVRWKRRGFLLPKAFQGMITSSRKSLPEDVTLKARAFAQRSKIRRGYQIILMMVDFFQRKRSLQEQYAWQNIETLQWQGVDKVFVDLYRMDDNRH